MAGLTALRDWRLWIALAAIGSLSVTLVYGLGEGVFGFAARCDNRDTVTFYFAARAALDGLDPYDNPALQQAYGVFAWWVYPPSGLPFFLPLTALSFPAAVIVFNVAKLLALAGLVAVWCKTVPRLRGDVAFWLFALVALNTTLLQDACSGNIAVFESLGSWSAVLLSLHRRFFWAVAVALLLALVKPLWLVLLLLPILASPRDAAARRAVALGLLTGGGLLVLWPMLDSASFDGWWHNARATLAIRYNLFELAKDIRIGLGGALSMPPWQRPEYALYALWLGVTAWLVWRVARSAPGLMAMMALLLAIAAASPANLSYSWVMTLPVVYIAIAQAAALWRWSIALLALLPPPLVYALVPLRDVGMTALLAVMIALLALATQTPHRNISLQTID